MTGVLKVLLSRDLVFLRVSLECADGSWNQLLPDSPTLVVLLASLADDIARTVDEEEKAWLAWGGERRTEGLFPIHTRPRK